MTPEKHARAAVAEIWENFGHEQPTWRDIITKHIRAAVAEQRQKDAEIVREIAVYWNAVAHEKRQAGKSDIDPAARAGEAATIADAIEAQ